MSKLTPFDEYLKEVVTGVKLQRGNELLREFEVVPQIWRTGTKTLAYSRPKYRTEGGIAIEIDPLSPTDWALAVEAAFRKHPETTQIIVKVEYPEGRTMSISPDTTTLLSRGPMAFIRAITEDIETGLKAIYPGYPEFAEQAEQADLLTSTFTLVQRIGVPKVFLGTNLKTQYCRRGTCETMSYESSGDNCLLAIIRAKFELKCQYRTMRKSCGLPVTGPIPFEMSVQIEPVYKVALNFYKMQGETPVLVKPSANKERATIINVLITKNGTHAEHILTFDAQRVEKPKKARKELVMAYDFETVYDKYGEMDAYMVSYMVSDMEGKTVMPAQALYCPDLKANSFIVDVIKNYVAQGHHIHLIGFNNSRFDDFILLPALISSSLAPVKPFIANNSILRMSFTGGETFDLCRHLSCSLKMAGQSFGSKVQKGTISHNDIQWEHVHGKLDQYVKKNLLEIIDYAKKDVEVLMEVFWKYKKVMDELLPIYRNTKTGEFAPRKQLLEFMTIGQLADAIFNRTIEDEEGNKLVELHKWESQTQAREAKKLVTAGRSDVFIKGDTEPHNVACPDQVSQYPAMMKNAKFVLQGRARWTDTFDPEEIGAYTIIVKSQPPCGVIPLKTSQGYDWHYRGRMLTTVLSPTLQTLIELGGEYELVEGITWGNTKIGIYKEYVDMLYLRKQEQDMYKHKRDKLYNPAMRAVVKLLLNSLSGKQIQRVFTVECALLENRKDLETFSMSHTNVELQNYHGIVIGKGKKLYEDLPKHSHLNGMLIYEAARRSMCVDLYSQIPIEQNVYTETDCGCMTREGWEGLLEKKPELLNKDPNAKILGLYEDEAEEMVVNFLNKRGLLDFKGADATGLPPMKITTGLIQIFKGGVMVDTEFAGPRVIVVGKKCHSYYVENTKTKERIAIKSKFKGVKTRCDEGCDPAECLHVAQVVSKTLFKTLRSKHHKLTQHSYMALYYHREFDARTIGDKDMQARSMVPGFVPIKSELTSEFVEPFQLKHYSELLAGKKLFLLTTQLQRCVSTKEDKGIHIKTRFLVKKVQADKRAGIHVDPVLNEEFYEKELKKGVLTKNEDGIMCSRVVNLAVFVDEPVLDARIKAVPITTPPPVDAFSKATDTEGLPQSMESVMSAARFAKAKQLLWSDMPPEEKKRQVNLAVLRAREDYERALSEIQEQAAQQANLSEYEQAVSELRDFADSGGRKSTF